MSSVALSGQAIGRKRSVPSGRNITRVFVIVIAVLLVILVLELLFHLVVAPRMVVRDITIVSDEVLGLDDASLLTIAGLTDRPFFFDVDQDAIAARLESYPLIKAAVVEKVFPDTLKIRVAGRKPLAVSLVESDGRTIPVVFDEEGVVFQLGTSVDDFDLPVVSGLTLKNVRLGQRVARPLIAFLSSLYALRSDEPALFSLISEVKFVKKDRSGFEVVLYPRDYPVRVLIGSEISGELMKRIILVLDAFARQGIREVEEIDFRTDNIVMRMRGE